MPAHPSAARPRRPREPAPPTLPAVLAEARLPAHDLVDDAILSSLSFTGLDLSGRTAESAEFARSRLTDTSQAGTSLRRCEFDDVEIDRCDLSGTMARATTVFSTAITASRLTARPSRANLLRDIP